MPSTASFHAGVHPGSERAQCGDGGSQEVRPQVRKCHAQNQTITALLAHMQTCNQVSVMECLNSCQWCITDEYIFDQIKKFRSFK